MNERATMDAEVFHGTQCAHAARVYDLVRDIPPGKVTTYGHIAKDTLDTREWSVPRSNIYKIRQCRGSVSLARAV
ncbi:hypothetical protein GLX27_000238 [Malassezia furfur]|uniref:Methylated-DNA-[protein]-cysteine S-methyltransferase DNA binding domain-containing protein n=1 Tax=Malassezia furfur TaxID=55194 RepID=A0ABY8EIN0_MALFU|nr:hypothetical protein GLX27_000238 [Malassezia furfur]